MLEANPVGCATFTACRQRHNLLLCGGCSPESNLFEDDDNYYYDSNDIKNRFIHESIVSFEAATCKRVNSE